MVNKDIMNKLFKAITPRLKNIRNIILYFFYSFFSGFIKFENLSSGENTM
jgi:hypothetical protein